MTTTRELNIKILRDQGLVARITTEDAESYKACWVFRSPPIELLTPPEPIPDRPGSISNARLMELTQTHKPPQRWYDSEEEQLF